MDNIFTKTPTDWSNKHILVVEDVDSNFLYVKAAFLITNVTLLWAKNGKDAIQLVKENPDIDLVLMDIQLPEMNGYDATKNIKKIRPEMPVIAQTAYAMAGEREKIFEAGCNDYVSKPIKLDILRNTVAQYLFQDLKSNA